MTLSASLRDNVVFGQHDLATDRSFNEFNVILCRNVMIHFGPDAAAPRPRAPRTRACAASASWGSARASRCAAAAYEDRYEVARRRGAALPEARLTWARRAALRSRLLGVARAARRPSAGEHDIVVVGAPAGAAQTASMFLVGLPRRLHAAARPAARRRGRRRPRAPREPAGALRPARAPRRRQGPHPVGAHPPRARRLSPPRRAAITSRSRRRGPSRARARRIDVLFDSVADAFGRARRVRAARPRRARRRRRPRGRRQGAGARRARHRREPHDGGRRARRRARRARRSRRRPCCTSPRSLPSCRRSEKWRSHERTPRPRPQDEVSILVVDDEPKNLFAVEAVLSGLGGTARDGALGARGAAPPPQPRLRRHPARRADARSRRLPDGGHHPRPRPLPPRAHHLHHGHQQGHRARAPRLLAGRRRLRLQAVRGRHPALEGQRLHRALPQPRERAAAGRAAARRSRSAAAPPRSSTRCAARTSSSSTPSARASAASTPTDASSSSTRRPAASPASSATSSSASRATPCSTTRAPTAATARARTATSTPSCAAARRAPSTARSSGARTGRASPSRASGTLLHDGHELVSVIVFRDVTERLQIERERGRLVRELEEAISARDDFLSIASHELRTPLTPIRLSVQSLKRKGQTPRGRHPQGPRDAARDDGPTGRAPRHAHQRAARRLAHHRGTHRSRALRVRRRGARARGRGPLPAGARLGPPHGDARRSADPVDRRPLGPPAPRSGREQSPVERHEVRRRAQAHRDRRRRPGRPASRSRSAITASASRPRTRSASSSASSASSPCGTSAASASGLWIVRQIVEAHGGRRARRERASARARPSRSRSRA